MLAKITSIRGETRLKVDLEQRFIFHCGRQQRANEEVDFGT